MKNIFVLLILLCASRSVLAHSGAHDHYGVIAFIHHFFTQPDHLLIMAIIFVSLILSRTIFRDFVDRLIKRYWFS